MKIRYHHLLCIPRFQGKGYSKEFCENLDKIKSSFSSESIELVSSCDDICGLCPNNMNGVCKNESKVMKYDAAVKNALKNGVKPNPEMICSDCEWFYICKEL